MICRKKKSYWQQAIHKREYLVAFLQGALILVVVSYLFYGTWLCAVLFLPYLFRYMKSWEKQKIKKKKELFHTQFKEAIQSLSAALNVGYSVENGLREAIKDLKGIYKKDALILRELTYITRQLQMNVTAEAAFGAFAARTSDEDVQTFVTVFNMAKRSGGDTMEMIRNVVRQMSDKLDVEREIQTLMSAKKLELKVMSIIPFGMIAYLRLSFPEFFNVLYGNATGVIIMSVCLGLYLAAYEMGKRIVTIEV